MPTPNHRRLRKAVAQLAACHDDDIAWIMDELTTAQRRYLTALVDSAAPSAAPPGDALQEKIDALLEASPVFLATRFRSALDLAGGEGRLTPAVRAALASALHEQALASPVAVALPPRPQGRKYFPFAAWRWRRA